MFRILKISVSLILLFGAGWLALRGIDLSSVVQTITKFDISAILLVASAIVISSIIAALRLRVVAGDFGYSLAFRDAVAALSLGQVGAALLFQLVGQLFARGSYLKQRDIPVAGTVLITVQERIAAAVVSIALAIVGALYLFHGLTFDVLGGGSEFVLLMLGLAVASGSAAFVWKDKIRAIACKITWNVARKFLRVAILSLGVQLATMAAYVYAGTIIVPAIGLLQLSAAAALVMFAASIPISFAGWGVREMSAIAAMTAIGMPAEGALTVAVLIGVLSIAIAALLALVSARSAAPSASSSVKANSHRDVDGMMMTVLPVLVAIFVFFQAHVPTKFGGLNVNIADPFAVLAGVMLVLSSFRRGWPRWRVSRLGWMVAACTTAMTVALINGAITIGWTQWALTNKYVGWFILLAYGAAGGLAMRAGTERVLRTFAVVGSGIIILCVALSLGGFEWPIEQGRFPGFAQNPNAFAFQCLMIVAAAAALPSKRSIPIALAVLGIWLTGSRAGLGAALVLLIGVVLLGRRPSFSNLSSPAVIAAIALAGVAATAIAASCSSGLTSWCGFLAHSGIALSSSNSEHLVSIVGGLKMFWSHPLFGAGLGAFIHDTAATGPRALVIHSTPIWLLTEFGIVGAAFFLWPVVAMVVGELRRRPRIDSGGRLLLLTITGLLVMSLAHELMYQRAFWFLLGISLVKSVPSSSTSVAQQRFSGDELNPSTSP